MRKIILFLGVLLLTLGLVVGSASAILDVVTDADKTYIEYQHEGSAVFKIDEDELVISVPVSMSGEMTYTGPSAVTITGDATNPIAYTGTVAATVAYTGSAAGVFGTVTLSATSGYTYNAFGGCFDVNFASGYAATSAGLVVGLYAGAFSSDVGNVPTACVWIEAIPGTGVDFSNMPLVVLTDSGAGTAPDYAFHFGSTVGGKNISTGTGNMFYQQTIKCAINGTDYFMMFSSVEGTFTTAYPIVTTSTLTVGASTAGTDVKFWGGLAASYVLWDASEDRLIVQNTFAADGDVSTYEYGQYNGMIFNTNVTTGKMVSGMKIAMEGTADYDSGSAVWPLWIDIQNTGTNNSDNFDMARFSVQAGACLPNSYISFQTASPGVDFLFEIVGNVSPYIGNAGTYTTADGYLLIDTPDGTRRIAIYAAVDG